MRVAIVTCTNIPEKDADEDLMLQALRQAGIPASLVAWDDARVDWTTFRGAIIRSTWNYHQHLARFLDWVSHTSTVLKLMNPAWAVRANAHKSYLARLQGRGIPIVPTAWVSRHENARPDLRRIISEQSWNTDDGIVIKPSVSASSFKTRRFHASELEAAQGFLEELLQERDAMVQPYLRHFAEGGESALVWLNDGEGGELTHKVTKLPRFGDDQEAVVAAADITDSERAFAERVLDVELGERRNELMYARIDVIDAGKDGLRLSELELIEPSLYLSHCEPALRRFVQAAGRVAHFEERRQPGETWP
ncbi:MAG TPA: hypothetical protein VG797_09880 [Phycisphaerales bacterium]|nr:hypothetical protein [Phycisphaerales bacterium]